MMGRIYLLIYFTVLASSWTILSFSINKQHFDRSLKRNFQVRKTFCISQSGEATTSVYDEGDLIKNSRPPSPSRVSYTELIRFGLPTLGIWLLQPILSLIDTAVIGMSPASSVAELAALGPGIAWVDSTSYLCYFLSVATTNLFANALMEKNEQKGRTVVANAGSLACFLGVILGFVQYNLAARSITLLSGTSLQSIPYGIEYARIRAFAAPAALLTMVAQSAFLAAKDSTTPLKAVLIGATVNIVGDLALVRGANLGIAGAAWATAGSQLSGIVYLIYAAIRLRLRQKHVSSPARLGISLKARWQRWLSIVREDVITPKFTEYVEFLRFCGPLFVVLLIKSFLWTFTTYAVSTAGAIDLAAHQIIINFFVMFCIFGDVVAQIAATYLPYTLQYPLNGEHSPKWNRDGKRLITQITAMGSLLGSMNSLIGYCLASFGAQFLTRSVAIQQKMHQVASLLALSALPHCLMLGYEGVIIAARDVSFLSWNYILLALFFISYQAHGRVNQKGIVGVWFGMVAFQWARLLFFYFRQKKIVEDNPQVTSKPIWFKYTDETSLSYIFSKNS